MHDSMNDLAFSKYVLLVGGVEQDVDVYGKTHVSSAFSEGEDSLSIAVYNASLSARFIRAPIAFETQTTNFIWRFGDLRSPITCANKSDIKRPRGLPSFC